MENVFVIYAERKSARLSYIVQTIFKERLGLDTAITTNREEFGHVHGPKLNYSREHIWECAQVIPAALLFEKRIQDQEIDVKSAEGLPLFYADSVNALGHDPLAACFYLLSRFEEYIPYRNDEHGRFTSSSSVLAKHDAIELPLVDLYVQRLAAWLKSIYPEVILANPSYKLEVTVDVDQLLMYQSKGIARSIAGSAKDALLNQGGFGKRMEVIFTQKRDPLDIYDDIIARCSLVGLRPIFFFQVGETSRFDINNPIHLPNVRNKINAIGVDAEIGLHPSYYTSEKLDMLELECDRLRSTTSNTISRSRQHYLRFRLPSTYRKLEDLGIEHDYSMGFPDANGFRASTSHPFRFFDLERDETTMLTIHPLVFMDMIALRKRDSLSACIEDAARLGEQVERVGGVFTTTWHPEALIGHGVPFPSMEILNSLLKTNDD